jgi:hypothetical protein
MYKHTVPEEKKGKMWPSLNQMRLLYVGRRHCISLHDLSKRFFVTYGTMESNMSCSVCNTDTSVETLETMERDIVC